MSQAKSERLLNLTIALLSARGYLTKREIRERVAGYLGQSEAAFERSFERDKEELRASGIAISVGVNADRAADETGYRILRHEFELPPIELTPEEAAVVGIASRSWSQADLARSTATAVRKLTLDFEGGQVELPWDPVVTVPEHVFRPFVDGLTNRTRVHFDYRNSRGEIARRTIETWGLSQSRGSWYVIGLDVDRAERRTFKLDRVIGEPVRRGAAHSYQVPDGIDLPAITRELSGQPAQSAVLAFRPGTEAALQRRGHPSEYPRPAAVPEDWPIVELRYSYEPGFVGEVAAAAGNVLVLDPPHLRDQVLERWAGVR